MTAKKIEKIAQKVKQCSQKPKVCFQIPLFCWDIISMQNIDLCPKSLLKCKKEVPKKEDES